MLGSLFDPVHRFLANPQLAWIMLWIGLAFLIIALVVMICTSWGQSHPLRKCAALSLLAHLLLAGYATTVHIVTSSGVGRRGNVDVMLVDGNPDGNADFGPLDGDDPGSSLSTTGTADAISGPATPTTSSPAATATSLSTGSQIATSPPPAPPPLLSVTPKPEPKPPDIGEPHVADASPKTDAEPKTDSPTPAASNVADAKTSEEPHTEPLPPPDALTTLPRIPEPPTASSHSEWVSGAPTGATKSTEPAPEGPLNDIAKSADPRPSGDANQAADATKPTDHNTVAITDSTGQPNSTTGGVGSGPVVEAVSSPIASRPAPQIYSDRIAGDRAAILRERGGSPEGESAVQAALQWLTANQSSDGHWDAGKFGAMQELAAAGRERQGAGGAASKADTAVTGLALLAFLGAGNTHLHGEYAKTVQHGLEYLLNVQAADGNLAGSAEMYAFMYAHGMSTLALSESYAMTGDNRLEPAVRAAIGFTVSAQISITGGWRYRAHEPASEMGDTSQLGWQLMSLKSAEMAGIEMPERTRDGVVRFVKSVSMGSSGGIASYQPGVRKPSRTMTAEALVCRQFLGMSRDNPASNEAGDYLLGELPAPERINLYYWYYATLGMYQLQGDHWQRWNAAMQNTLIRRQRLDGDAAGSWDPDCLWGGYGGRVYSTAMSSLCLEVYYRYLPIYRTAGKEQAIPAR